jgi:hypothetical protein
MIQHISITKLFMSKSPLGMLNEHFSHTWEPSSTSQRHKGMLIEIRVYLENYYNLASSSVWVGKIVSDIKEGTWTAGVGQRDEVTR